MAWAKLIFLIENQTTLQCGVDMVEAVALAGGSRNGGELRIQNMGG